MNCLPIVGYFSLFLSFLVDGEHSYIFILLSHDLLGINSLERIAELDYLDLIVLDVYALPFCK